jgi:hypothetical protein
VRDELFHADRHDETDSRFRQFCERDYVKEIMKIADNPISVTVLRNFGHLHLLTFGRSNIVGGCVQQGQPPNRRTLSAWHKFTCKKLSVVWLVMLILTLSRHAYNFVGNRHSAVFAKKLFHYQNCSMQTRAESDSSFVGPEFSLSCWQKATSVPYNERG